MQRSDPTETASGDVLQLCCPGDSHHLAVRNGPRQPRSPSSPPGLPTNLHGLLASRLDRGYVAACRLGPGGSIRGPVGLGQGRQDVEAQRSREERGLDKAGCTEFML